MTFKFGILVLVASTLFWSASSQAEGDGEVTLDDLFPCHYVSEGPFQNHYRVNFICASDEDLDELAKLYSGCHELGFEETETGLEILTGCEFNNQKQYYHLSINALRVRGIKDEGAMWLKYIIEVKRDIKNGTYVPPASTDTDEDEGIAVGEPNGGA